MLWTTFGAVAMARSTVIWPPAGQCFAAGSANVSQCQPGVERCQAQAWGGETPQYHLRDETCLVGDPNEPVYDPTHKMYHIFWQVGSARFPGSPATKFWSGKDSFVQGPLQGHAVSRDLVKWAHLPVALWNDQPYDSVAIYTGSATVVNGTVQLIYPGVCDGSRQGSVPHPLWPSCSDDGAYHYNLVRAEPADPTDRFLTNWTKHLIVNNTQRDPSGAWLTPSGQWRMLTWDQVFWGSVDFMTWEKIGQPFGLPVGDCPSFFPLPRIVGVAGQQGAGVSGVIKSQPQQQPTHVHKVSASGGDWYLLGLYEEGSGLSPGSWIPIDQPSRLLDYGLVYASKDFFDPVFQRRIMWGHVSTGDDTGNCMTLPREVLYHAELQQLLFAPLVEQEQLRGRALRDSAAVVLAPNTSVMISEANWPEGAVRQAEALLELALPAAAARLTLTLYDADTSPDAEARRRVSSTAVHYHIDYSPPALGQPYTAVVGAVCDSGSGCSGFEIGGARNATLALLTSDESLSLRVFTDQQMSEVYWQDGRVVFTTATALSSMQAPAVRVVVPVGSAPWSLKRVRCWTVDDIWVEPSKI